MRLLRKLLFAGLMAAATGAAEPTLTGTIVDGDSQELVPARLYIRGPDGAWHHARSIGGTALPYKVQRGQESIEVHTTLSAHRFEADLPPGRYTLTARRGKEYHPAEATVVIESGAVTVKLAMNRWTTETLASRGWYSGDTHVHRKVEELRTLLLAEDLNVGLPLTSWVTDSREAPNGSNKNRDPVPAAKLIAVDPEHVIWPVNTEYEIFTVGGKSHTLGAVFALNHKEPFTLTAPPVGPIAAEARRQGALLDLDKHNWPWSMMLVPVMGVNLFELTNNHLWRTEFHFNRWQEEYTPAHWNISRDEHGYTERGWIDFGFRNYYALLNCGFDLKPSAGTASGVHPVPLGFGRVYVHLDGGFAYEKWIKGLAAGDSFVTTGPILTTSYTGEGATRTALIRYESRFPPGPIEVIVNGKVHEQIDAQPMKTERGGYEVRAASTIKVERTSWIAVRAWEDRPDGRPRFAHTAPTSVEVAGRPLLAERADVDYLVGRVEDELKRHAGVLSEVALEEYRAAAAAYRRRLPE